MRSKVSLVLNELRIKYVKSDAPLYIYIFISIFVYVYAGIVSIQRIVGLRADFDKIFETCFI